MRAFLPVPLVYGRVREGLMASDDSYGPNGKFILFKERGPKTQIVIVASVDDEWEHVSVSTATRCPTWEEMCLVKDLFWTEDECVMQLHPPKAEWISNHPYCLHMWRPARAAIPRPPGHLVGVAGRGELSAGEALLHWLGANR